MPATDEPLTAGEKEVVKAYGGWTAFMQCFGLKPWEFDDIDEAHQIAKGMAEQDLAEKNASTANIKK